jgi:DNA-damage-inducible protein D
MGSTELAANLFQATQAREKLRREKITGKETANQAHREVGAKVGQTIKELGGTMPEHLPAAESIKKLESKQRKALKVSPKNCLPHETPRHYLERRDGIADGPGCA